MVNVNDNPPPYDYTTFEGSQAQKPAPASNLNPPAAESPHKNNDSCQERPVDVTVYTMQAGPSYVPGQSSTVYHYFNPVTAEQVSSMLPPDHPEMICLQEGQHIRRTRFGLLGVLAAVFWFPLGIGLCLLDRRVTCERCGRTIADGILC